MCLCCLDALFDDKRVVTGVLMLYLTLVLVVMKEIGLLDSAFMNTGPSESTSFMGVKLNTWYKWNLVAIFTFVNTSVNDFMSDAISPWILNTITDHKTKYIPYSKCVCLIITQLWSFYCNIMSVFAIFLAMSQIDFVLIRMCADLTVNAYTTTKFIRHKTYCPNKYKKYWEVDHEMDHMANASTETAVFTVSDSLDEEIINDKTQLTSKKANDDNSKV
jgi:hypothetical protein